MGTRRHNDIARAKKPGTNTLKILIVSWYFPPVNTIGALRVGKFARFLIEQGHDVGVVAGKYWGHPETLPLGVPLARVAYAKSVDVNAPPSWLQRRLSALRGKRPAGESPATSVSAGSTDSAPKRQSVLHRASDLYVNLTNLPGHPHRLAALGLRRRRQAVPGLAAGSAVRQRAALHGAPRHPPAQRPPGRALGRRAARSLGR